MEFPKTLTEFQAAYPDEDACTKALRKMRWPEGFVCPRCQHTESSFVQTRKLEQCGGCRYQCSVTAGTIFHGTRTPLLTWFWAIFFLTRHKQGISALQLQRDTGIGSYGTAWTMLHKLRSTLKPRPEFRLQGIVEADESYVGGPEPGLRGGRQVGSKTIVGVAVEQREHTAGKVRLTVLGSRSTETCGRSSAAWSTRPRPRFEPMGTARIGPSPRWGSAMIATSRASQRGPTRSCPGRTRYSAISRPGCAAPSTASAASTCHAIWTSSAIASIGAGERASSSTSCCAGRFGESPCRITVW